MMDSGHTYIIAEAGVNHNGSMKLAHELIQQASAIGADAIKFQCFQTDKIVIPSSPKADYQNESCPESKTQYELLKSLELAQDDFLELQSACKEHKIDFLTTPFDLDSLAYLIDIGMDIIKISSGDLTFGPLLLKAAQSGKRVFLSTGMADEDEIQQALAVLAYGYLYPNQEPNSLREICDSSLSDKAQRVIQKNVVVFHCTSEYPAPFSEINLNALQSLRKRFSVTMGYSDHSKGILVSSLAVALGARVIEKHITLDNELPGPDHKASLNIEQFSKMIQQIRLTETILGSYEKRPTHAELNNKSIVRRGLYAKNTIEKGQCISSNDLSALRPAAKTSPMQFWDMIEKEAACDYKVLDEI